MTELLHNSFGDPIGSFSVAEFGCGTGRVTQALAPYARRLVLADYSPTMIEAVTTKFPDAETLCADTRGAVEHLHMQGWDGGFEVVAAFWSLSYPLGEFFETLSANGIEPCADLGQARVEAMRFLRRLVRLVAPGGHLLALFFDADTREQRLVTRQWERIAPFPEGGRGYTRDLLVTGLRDAEDAGLGTLTHTRRGGAAWAPSRETALAWLQVVHLKSHPALIGDSRVREELSAFVDRYVQPDGSVHLPSGAHVIDFHRSSHPICHVPLGSRP
ncbi:class I SAM-dependent methyltransferase [Nocardia sp. NPDC050175]|uniref:class I SAM-dependent methyltransferase n=1 Tax=Nocardia sp. NPDC050175 TaxID=3364317 RepID=UPI00378DA5A5